MPRKGPRKIYALLVGIDAYLGDVPALHGCVNDIRAVETLLPTLVTDGVELDVERLLDGDATRDNVIAGFRQHLTQAKADDIALFWYSGHGSQQPTAPEFAAVEPDGLDETIVCVDSRLPGKWDLADKELAALVAEVGKSGPEVLVVLDCCHSGSGVRAAAEGADAVRRAPLDPRVRAANTLLSTARTTPTDRRISGWDLGKQADYVLLSACRSDETAKEVRVDGQSRGAFSAAVESALVAAGGRIGYSDLVEWTRSRLRALVSQQNPQLECTDPNDAGGGFLGGTAAGVRGYRLLHDKAGWYIDAGAVHGIPAPNGGETVVLAVHKDANQIATARVTTARVTTVLPERSAVAIDGAELDTEAFYRVTVVAWPVARMSVAIDGPAEKLRAVLTDSRLVYEKDSVDAQVLIQATESGYELSRSGRGTRLAHVIEGVDNTVAVLDALDRMSRWQLLRDLVNPAGAIAAGDLAIEVSLAGTVLPGHEECRVVYAGDPSDGGPTDGDTAPLIKIKVTNNSAHDLFVSILFLDEEHAVETLTDKVAVELIPSKTSLWAAAGQELEVTVPEHLVAGGVTEVTDLIKVIACTEQFDARALLQPALHTEVRDEPVRGVAEDNVLDQLLLRAKTRRIGLPKAARDAQWQAVGKVVVVERPRSGTAVAANATTMLDGGVEIDAPAGFAGSARLAALPSVARDLGRTPVPAILLDPEIAEPFDLVTTRGDADLSVLELEVRTGTSSVTVDTPLVVRVPTALADGEHVLPFAYDGEYWIPVGRVTKRGKEHTEFALETLPASVASERTLWNSVRILFRKLVGTKIGLKYTYPRLAAATIHTNSVHNGQVTFDTDTVADKVKQAKRILLVLHGIIGESKGIVEYVHRDNGSGPLSKRYDLVLAFDYESIGTGIDSTAVALRDKLAAAGLPAAHKKRLDIVAHSMGGLAVRWMLEKEADAPKVHTVVLAGVPHTGSPWPTIQGWASTALGFALNLVTWWPASIIGGLVGAIEKVDDGLDQLQADSALLKELGTGKDPGIGYHLVIGNQSLDADKAKGLLGRLRGHGVLDLAAALAFFGKPNDIAVSVVSAGAVPDNRATPSQRWVIHCDHMSYFEESTSVARLDALLGQED
jgi:hypothetical protein